jgi:Tfp pilus assembly protein PilZ
MLAKCRKFLRFAKWSGERLKVNVAVHYSGSTQQSLTGNLGDISVGGIFLETERLMPIGAELNVAFKFSDDSPTIRCKGKVTWINSKENIKKGYSTGMGIEFMDIRKLDILVIQSWIGKNRPGGEGATFLRPENSPVLAGVQE